MPPTRPDDESLDRLLAAVVARLDPDAVYLFGSRARGEARPDSDWDLLVVLPDDAPPERRDPQLAYRAALAVHMAADIVPWLRRDFERFRNRVGTLSYEATHNGHLVYSRQ